MKEELVTKRHVLISHLDEFDANNESDYDDLLETLSSKCSIPVSDLSLVQLSADQLGSILTALDNLLFDEWISAPPSLSTLQHAQVLITELCALSLEISEGVSLKGISNHVQSLVSHISQSACNVSESFLLTQALYLNLMHFFTDPGSCDAAFIAKQWAEQDLTAEDLFLIEFLGTLTTSLQSAVGRATTFILKMEIQCLELLLSTLTHVNGKKRHVGCIEILLRIVQTNKWTPTEAVTLLKVLSEKYKEDAPITEVLTLVQVYDLSPEWTDDSGHSVTQALDVLGPERFLLDFCKTLRKQDESSLDSALAELKTLNNLDESVVTMIKNITNGVLKYSEKAPKGEPFMRDSFKSGNLNANEIQNSLSQLCKAVSDTKGWWPTVLQMLRWCMLVLTEKTETQGLVGVKLDPCVTAMFAATKVLMGKKVDIVLSSNIYSLNQTKEWSDFYKHLGISLNQNLREDNTSLMVVYEADIVYGTMDDFVYDYLQCGLKGIEAGSPLLSRGFLIEDRCLSASYNLELSVLKENDALVFASETLQSLMGIFYSEEMELRDKFIASLFQVLHSNLNKRTDEDSKVIAISQKCTGKDLPSNKVYILSILEKLLHEFSGETEYHLRQIFEMKDVRTDRSYQCIIIDEVDSLLLDQGVQLTYLSSPMVSMQHLNVILAMIWGHASQYGFLSTGHITFVQGPPSSFYKSIFDSIDMDGIDDPMDVLHIAEETGIVPKGFTEEMYNSEKDKLLRKLKTVSQDDVIDFFQKIEQYVPYGFTVYTLDDNGLLSLRKSTPYNNPDIPELTFLVLDDGLCSALYDSEEVLANPITEFILEKIQYTPCTNNTGKISIPGFLKNLIESKLPVWVQNAFLAKRLRHGREYVVENDCVCPVDYRSTGIVELSKKWGDGLQHRSDKDSLSKIDKKLDPGDVIVATNLAGRGTNIKVSNKVNKNGGLFVVLSFLSENRRVELQAFGRTARKGKPGSAQIIMTTDHVQDNLKTVSSLEEAKETRNRLAAKRTNDMTADVTEMKLREDLFAEYCKTLQGIYRNTDGDDQTVIVAVMNEFWGIWLQTKSEEIDNLKRNELEKSLKADLSLAQSQSQSQTSPCSSIYHYIKFGNLALGEKKWDVSMKLFEKAMVQDESWAAIAFYNHAYCSIKQQNGDYLTTASNDLKKAQESLKYLSEECMVCLQFVKMASVELKSSEQPTSLEKQLTTKCNLFSYFDKNICEAIEKLKEIKDKGRDATTKKLPMFSLVSSTDEDLQTEAYNLYSKGLEYVFSVEEQPRFPWEAFLVFCLGILQIVGGALLTAFTFGTLAQVGMGLIVEGVSDCITGVESMITGEFSWQSWAIEKAISIGISLIGFGVGKLISKGFKAAKMLVKGLGKKLKSLPKFFSKQVKEGLSVVSKTNMKNAVKQTAKKMAEEIISYAFGKAEDAVLQEILKGIKNEMTKGIANDVKTNMEKDPLAGLVDSILLSHLEDKKQMSDLLQDKNRKSKLLGIFKQISKTALQPFYADLKWQNKLNSSIAKVIDSAASEAKGKTLVVLKVIQGIHMASLAAEATSAVLSLSSQFFSNLHKELNTFKEKKQLTEKVKRNYLSASEMKILEDFKQDLVNETSALLADALVEVFHQKFSSHFVSKAVGQVNNTIRGYVKTGLKSEKTEDKLRAGQNNRYISYMSVDMNSKHKQDRESGKRSESHAEKIKDSSTATTILDIRVLSETTGTKVVILTQDSHGKLIKMQELSPSTKSASQTVTLIYNTKSSQHPDGHYDVSINNKTVKVTTKEKSSLFHALAQGLKPKATKEEIALEAGRLRSLEADALVKHSDRWEPFLKYKERTDEIRGGDWYMAKEAGLKETVKENKKVIKDGKVKKYNNWIEHVNSKPSTGQFIKAAHQPPVSSISQAGELNQNSKLTKAMLEVVTKSTADVENYKGLGLPTIYVPTEIQHEFPSTTTKQFRKLLARTISQDYVVSVLKLTILGAMPRFKFNSAKNYRDFKNNRVSKTRLAIFENNFEQHSKDLVNKWFNHLQDKGVMSKADLDTLTAWINNRDYENQSDPHRKQVSNLL
ncbi:uncharacterized protein LOC128437932 [Pleuronectes platessa]|uniref:uncharacterized protein LOC128437932 n=1 Tax=Pleuronectes platessa TaxID=8262 RepID=UPI00232A2B88|nr:uncharacterized protein LOC128437932 [Pleuronectes platessa]